MNTTDSLDDLIYDIQTSDARLSAAARNALHGATSTHPWCKGKDLPQRIAEVRCAIAGRGVHAALLHRLERIYTPRVEAYR